MRRLIRQRGLTVIELMVGLAITAVLITAAAPSFVEYVQNAKVREAGNALLAEALFAQSEAIKRNGTVTLTTNGDAVSVTDTSTPPLNRQRTLPASTSAGTVTVNFNSEGRLAADVSIDISASGITCSSALRCPRLRIDAGGAIRLCGDKTSSSC